MAAPTNMFAPFASNVNKNSVGVNFLTTKVVDAIQNNWVYEQIVQVIQAQPDGINEKGKFTPKGVKKNTNLFVEPLSEFGVFYFILVKKVWFSHSDNKLFYWVFVTRALFQFTRALLELQEINCSPLPFCIWLGKIKW